MKKQLTHMKMTELQNELSSPNTSKQNEIQKRIERSILPVIRCVLRNKQARSSLETFVLKELNLAGFNDIETCDNKVREYADNIAETLCNEIISKSIAGHRTSHVLTEETFLISSPV